MCLYSQYILNRLSGNRRFISMKLDRYLLMLWMRLYKKSSVARPKCTMFRGMNRETSFCSVNSLVYSGTKRSTTSEGLREATAGDRDVRKRKENIKINNGLWHTAQISESRSQIPTNFKNVPFVKGTERYLSKHSKIIVSKFIVLQSES